MKKQYREKRQKSRHSRRYTVSSKGRNRCPECSLPLWKCECGK